MDACLLPRARMHPTIALAALLAVSALPAHAADANRYALTASAALHPSAAVVQKSDRFSLKAAIAGTDNGAFDGSGYSLAAYATPLALVCTPDTIFMDGFDGG